MIVYDRVTLGTGKSESQEKQKNVEFWTFFI